MPNFIIVAKFKTHRRRIPHKVRARAHEVRRITSLAVLADPITETVGAGWTAETDFSFRVAGPVGGILNAVLVVAYPTIGCCCDKGGSPKDN